MVNSGSSANLLALSVMTNPLRRITCAPATRSRCRRCAGPRRCGRYCRQVCPGARRRNPTTLNLSIPSLRAALKKHDLKAVLMVHVLGNSTELKP